MSADFEGLHISAFKQVEESSNLKIEIEQYLPPPPPKRELTTSSLRNRVSVSRSFEMPKIARERFSWRNSFNSNKEKSLKSSSIKEASSPFIGNSVTQKKRLSHYSESEASIKDSLEASEKGFYDNLSSKENSSKKEKRLSQGSLYSDSEESISDSLSASIKGAYEDVDDVDALLRRKPQMESVIEGAYEDVDGFALLKQSSIGGEVYPTKVEKRNHHDQLLANLKIKYPESSHLLDVVASKFDDPSELERVFDYIEEHKSSWFAKNAEPGAQGLFLSRKETGLSRTIQVTAQNQIFIHLYKKTPYSPPVLGKKHKTEDQLQEKNKAFLGKGNFKVVTYALDYGNMEVIAKATTSLYNAKIEEDARREELLHHKLRGKEGIVEIYAVTYQEKKAGSSKSVRKQNIWMPVYSKTLSKIKQSSHILSHDEWKNIIRTGLEGLKKMHESQIAHRDITLDNLYAIFDSQGKIQQILISDFGLSGSLGDPLKRVHHINLPPEGGADGVAHDLWGFGIMLYFLKNSSYPPYLEKFRMNVAKNKFHLAINYPITPGESPVERQAKIDKEALVQAVAKLQKAKKNMAEPKSGTLDHLIWRMLRVHKEDRISSEETLRLIKEDQVVDLASVPQIGS